MTRPAAYDPRDVAKSQAMLSLLGVDEDDDGPDYYDSLIARLSGDEIAALRAVAAGAEPGVAVVDIMYLLVMQKFDKRGAACGWKTLPCGEEVLKRLEGGQ